MRDARSDLRVQDWIARARAVSVEQAAMILGAKLPPAGVERSGHCPAGCTRGGDGFAINTRKQVFLCRPGGAQGDVIAMVQHVHGCSFSEAVETLTGEPRPGGREEESAEERRAREAARAQRDERAARHAREAQEAETSKEERDRREIERILKIMVPIAGTDAAEYLKRRGLELGPWCDGFGFVPELPYWGEPCDEDSNARRDRGEPIQRRLLASPPAMIAPIVRSGAIIGLHRTFLSPDAPEKFRAPNPPGKRINPSKKMLGEATGGLIPLGEIGETLAVGEGIETTRSWYCLNRFSGEDISLAAAGSLGNLSGGVETQPHPTKVNPATGKPYLIPNGVPKLDAPGMILPPQVKRLILIGDGDSEPISTRARLLAAARRHRAEGVEILCVDFAPLGSDFNEILMSEMKELQAP